MKPAVLLILFAVSVVGCSGKNPAAPAPIPACQTNNTATLTLSNTSTTNTTQTHTIDGITAATLAPGQSSQPFTLAAGVAHTVTSKVTNTNAVACNPATPILIQCENRTISCSR